MKRSVSARAPHLLFLAMLVLVAILPMAGCVQTAMRPAEQMEAGETVASVSAGEPGAFFMPRLGIQATRGFGGGDLSFNLSSTPGPGIFVSGGGPVIFALGGGMTGRYYLTNRLNAEAQLQITSFSSDTRRTAGLALFGLQTTPPREGSWYYGAHAGVIRGPSPDVYTSGSSSPGNVPIWTDPVVGGTVGYGPIELGSGTRMQFELEANLPIWGAKSEPPMPSSGVSVGVFGLFQ